MIGTETVHRVETKDKSGEWRHWSTYCYAPMANAVARRLREGSAINTACEARVVKEKRDAE